MLSLIWPNPTWLHRCRAGAKLIALAGATMGLFWASSLWLLLAAAALCALIYLSCGLAFARRGARLLRPLWLFALLVGLWHGLSGDFAGAAIVILRMFCTVAAANLVTMTTRLEQMMAVIEGALCVRLGPLPPLERLIAPRRLALAFALVIRFIPVMADRTAQLRESWRARSPKRASWRIVPAAVLSALDDAEHVAESLRARGGA